jgi:hypothetical protein
MPRPTDAAWPFGDDDGAEVRLEHFQKLWPKHWELAAKLYGLDRPKQERLLFDKVKDGTLDRTTYQQFLAFFMRGETPVVLVPASQIEYGQYFRKKTGAVIYVRAWPGALKAIGLDPDAIVGFTPHGQASLFKADTLVARASESEMGYGLSRALSLDELLGLGDYAPESEDEDDQE